jgi:hypothetical protein
MGRPNGEAGASPVLSRNCKLVVVYRQLSPENDEKMRNA